MIDKKQRNTFRTFLGFNQEVFRRYYQLPIKDVVGEN